MMKSVASIVVGVAMIFTALVVLLERPDQTVGEVPEPSAPRSGVPERVVADPVYAEPVESSPQVSRAARAGDADDADVDVGDDPGGVAAAGDAEGDEAGGAAGEALEDAGGGAASNEDRAEEADRPRGSDPHHLTIPEIGVDNAIVEVGLHPDGSMEIPDDVSEIGWYTPTGIAPGDEGSAVMAGHVDSRSQGPGAFFDLRALDVGDEITVATDDGEQVWEVTGRTQYDKDYLPVDEIFTTEGDPRLVLITCGGPFDSDTRHYTENTVVYAQPVT